MSGSDAGTAQRTLVGRIDERRRLDDLLTSVRAGESRTLVISGEPGVGKTALLDYAADAAKDFRLERAAGVDCEAELAFATLQQLCTPMLGRLDRLAGPQRHALEVALGLRVGSTPDRFLVSLAVLGLLSECATDQPLLCVIDDMHWVDQPSARTLAFVARRLADKPVAILFGSQAASPELEQLPALTLSGLESRAASRLLLSSLRSPIDKGVRERVIAETHGNPLALLDLRRGLTTMDLAGGFGLTEAQLAGPSEQGIADRLAELPNDARRLLLVAAAEPVGDPILLVRACERLGLSSAATAPPDEMIDLGDRVTFRHPLVRRAVYRSASPDERRRVHMALAEVTDSDADPDRRAWHLAAASTGPDELVALELERSADKARARGGLAAAAAFLRRAALLTLDSGRQVERVLAAAQASVHAGLFEDALRLIRTADNGTVDEFQRARIDFLREQIAFALHGGDRAPTELLRAVGRIEKFDTRLARVGYLATLCASLVGGGVRDVAGAIRAGKVTAGAGAPTEAFLNGWAAMFVDGCAAAAPALQEALRSVTDATVTWDAATLLRLATLTAAVLWDDAEWDKLSGQHVELVRNVGALGELPFALNSRSFIHLFRGELATASSMLDEASAATEATGANYTSWGAIGYAALRGCEQEATVTLDKAGAHATSRGEKTTLTVIAWARALLNNGLGSYDEALVAARKAIDCPTNSLAAAWAMAEFVEAAARVGQLHEADKVSDRFAAIATAAGSDWVQGINLRLKALVSDGAAAEESYCKSLDCLQRCQVRIELARTHLLYGEWLRRESRRVDARAQLRLAHDHFVSIGMQAFAERAQRELLATGETVRKRTVETRDDLTPQERQIADLASSGLSNPEIGARLFLSRRTVEWHLRHVYAKLDIRSRRELAHTLGLDPATSSRPSRQSLNRPLPRVATGAHTEAITHAR